MTKRTIPTPANGIKVPSGVHAMRRGGARREVTERVTLRDEKQKVLEGWALNVSRGGLRAILEEKVTLGQKFSIGIGSDEVLQRSGRVVWVQEEPDGVIVGLEFTSLSGVHSSAPPPPPAAIAASSSVSPSSSPLAPDDATERSTFEPDIED
ncbi:hypothetical protein AKJ09_06219 [Labilithrix luteola]|uniref:PilZ domain-containing protein n=1 Tax=Labilithrix luteola TaxID=1391654 RepID=A0A0K1Q192_9BACT|nr:PilZ domain-containing protein [Labilithrix luteola]AKU99555.1 hypothetical protein AKJ09_06219 [Labilithrix luteola]